MHVEKRTALHPLTLAITLALAACGGGQDTPQTDAGGPQTKAATDLTVTTQDSSATPHATASGRTTKEAVTPDTPPIANSKIRGDVLIQALLSRTARHDEQGAVQTVWLPPETVTRSEHEPEPLAGPVLLADEDIRPADAAAPNLGKYYYQTAITTGPGRSGQGANVISVNDQRLRFGLSSPGLPNGGTGTLPTVVDTLEISKQAHLQLTTIEGRTSPPIPQQHPMAAEQPSTLHTNEVYKLPWSHSWKRSDRPYSYPFMSVYATRGDTANQFYTCMSVSEEYERSNGLCDIWEVPNNWKPGQPLTHVAHRFKMYRGYETANVSYHWEWSNRKSRQYIDRNSLKTTTQAVNEYGISGALLAAMLDVWTPRGKGMQSLPPYATAARNIASGDASKVNPQRISFHHDSRATTYADGSTDTNTYSPATGNYLHAFSTGTWLSEQAPDTPSPGYWQATLATHVNADAHGLTLARWAGLDISGSNRELQTITVREDGRLVGNGTTRTIAANALIPFGSTVQAWYELDPKSATAVPRSKVELLLSKDQDNPRDVGLCWNVAVDNDRNFIYCTRWTVPDGWSPGQALKPRSYDAALANSMGTLEPVWDTSANGK